LASRQRVWDGRWYSVPKLSVSITWTWRNHAHLTPMLGPVCAGVSPGKTLSGTASLADSWGFSCASLSGARVAISLSAMVFVCCECARVKVGASSPGVVELQLPGTLKGSKAQADYVAPPCHNSIRSSARAGPKNHMTSTRRVDALGQLCRAATNSYASTPYTTHTHHRHDGRSSYYPGLHPVRYGTDVPWGTC